MKLKKKYIAILILIGFTFISCSGSDEVTEFFTRTLNEVTLLELFCIILSINLLT